MNQSIKQRIVGIVVILTAAIVLLLVLFDGQGSYRVPLASRIPQSMPFPEPPSVIPERPVIVADTDQIRVDAAASVSDADVAAGADIGNDPDATAGSTDQVSSVAPDFDQSAGTVASDLLPNNETVVTQAGVAEPPALDNAGLPQGWSVRLASFSSLANASALVENLQSRGHRAYTREINSEQGILTAVFVGPGVDRVAVQQLQRQLLEEFQLSGIVVRYEIEDL